MKHHGADILSACSSGGSTSSDRCVLYRFAALVNRLDWRLWNLDKKDIGALELYSVVIELQRRFDGISSKVRYPVDVSSISSAVKPLRLASWVIPNTK